MNEMNLWASLAVGAATALAIAPPASAQVTVTSTSQTATVSGYNPNASGTAFVTRFSGPVPNGAVQYNYAADQVAFENYQVSTSIGNTTIDFANNATSQGFAANTSTSTSITINYTSLSATPTLISTIIPAGFGFYVANTVGNPSLVPGSTSVGNINLSPSAADETFYGQDGWYPGASVQVGSVSVDFQILNGSTQVADYSANLTLSLTGAVTGSGPTGFITALTASPSLMSLTNFGAVASDTSQNVVGYQWDATNVAIPLSGPSGSVTYITTVSAMTTAAAGNSDANLLGYAGFGDPIGRTVGSGGVNDPHFPLLELSVPTSDAAGNLIALSFNNQYTSAPLPVLDLDNSNDPSGNPLLATAVPEPSTWALLLLGLGGIGTMLRRQARLHRKRPGRIFNCGLTKP
jgi:hypothetical protein